MVLDDRLLSRPLLTMELKLKLSNFLQHNCKLCQFSMRSLFLELCVRLFSFLERHRRLNIYSHTNLTSLPLVMANDFDGQIDYLEQFGSSSVSHFLHTSPNDWIVVACSKQIYTYFCSLKSQH